MRNKRSFTDSIGKFYYEGIQLIDNYHAQLAHFTCIIAILAVLWQITSKYNFVICAMLFSIYFVNLAINGYKKFWSITKVDDEAKEIKQKCMRAYLIIDVALLGAGCVLLGVKLALSITIIFIVVSYLFYRAGAAALGDIVTIRGNLTIWEKIRNLNPGLYSLVYNLLLRMLFLIPVMILPSIPVISKIILVSIYLLIIPIIARLADDGANIAVIFK